MPATTDLVLWFLVVWFLCSGFRFTFTRSLVMARSAGESSYSMDTYGHSSRGQMPGSHYFKPGAHVQQWKPSWENKYAVFRIWPRFNGQIFEPMRDPAKVQANSDLPFTDWIRRYDAAVAVGLNQQQVSYFVRDPTDPESRAQPDPLAMLYNALEAAVKQQVAKPNWYPLRERQGKGGKPLHRSDDLYFVEGFVLEQDSKPKMPWVGSRPDDATPVIVLPRSAGMALITELNRRDANNNYVHQDILDTRAGCYAYFVQAGAMPHPALLQAGLVQPPQAGQAIVTGGDTEFKKYSCALAPVYYGTPAAVQNLEGLIAKNWKEWDEILHFPSVAEQVAILCTCGFPADLLMYALGDQFGQYIPQSIRERAQAMSQHVAQLQPPMQPGYAPPGYSFPPVAPAQPGYQQYPPQQPPYQPPVPQPPYQPSQTAQPYPPQTAQPYPQPYYPPPGEPSMYPPGTPPHLMQPAVAGPTTVPDATVQAAPGAFGSPQYGQPYQQPPQPQPPPTQPQYQQPSYQPPLQQQPQYGQPYQQPPQQPPYQQPPQQPQYQQPPPQQQPQYGQPYQQPQQQPPMGAPSGPLPPQQPVTQPPMSPQAQPQYADPSRQAATVEALAKARANPRPPTG
jgi:hypothetical protein